MLEAGDGVYFAHSLNQCSLERVDGHVFVNPRDTWKRGFGFPVLLGEQPDDDPELIWRSRYGSVTFNPLAREMPDGGMNEAGLFIWEMGFEPEYPEDETVPTLFQMQWMQYQLDNYATVEEVLANVDRVVLDGWGWHYFVADRSGNAAIIDHLDGEARVYTGRELPIPLCCNSSYAFAMEFLSQHEGFGGDIEIEQVFEEVPRFIYGAKLLGDYGGEEPVQYCLDVLAGMSRCVRWSIVFDVEAMAVHFITNVAGDRRSFSFTSADFDPARGTRMLDANEPLSGDVRNKLGPYDRSADLKVVEGILSHFLDESADVGLAAEAAVDRLAYRDLAAAYEIRGSWRGSLMVPAETGDQNFPVVLDIAGEEDSLSGSIEGEILGGRLPLHNVRYAGGLLDFTSRDPDTGQLLRFQLHANGRTLEGSAWNWDWDNMMTLEENQTIAVLGFTRP
jgi:choloylglycine hydrolase